MFVVMMGWVIFRADTFKTAGHYFHALFLPSHLPAAQPLARYNLNEVLVGHSHWYFIQRAVVGLDENNLCKAGTSVPGALASDLCKCPERFLKSSLIVMLLFASFACLAGGTYNPFIYFRF